MKVRLGVDVRMSEIHCTRLSLFFHIVKMDPRNGYEVGVFDDLGFLRRKKRSGKIMVKRRMIEK